MGVGTDGRDHSAGAKLIERSGVARSSEGLEGQEGTDRRTCRCSGGSSCSMPQGLTVATALLFGPVTVSTPILPGEVLVVVAGLRGAARRQRPRAADRTGPAATARPGHGHRRPAASRGPGAGHRPRGGRRADHHVQHHARPAGDRARHQLGPRALCAGGRAPTYLPGAPRRGGPDPDRRAAAAQAGRRPGARGAGGGAAGAESVRRPGRDPPYRPSAAPRGPGGTRSAQRAAVAGGRVHHARPVRTPPPRRRSAAADREDATRGLSGGSGRAHQHGPARGRRSRRTAPAAGRGCGRWRRHRAPACGTTARAPAGCGRGRG